MKGSLTDNRGHMQLIFAIFSPACLCSSCYQLFSKSDWLDWRHYASMMLSLFFISTQLGSMGTNGGNNYLGLQTTGSTPTSASADTRMHTSGGSGNLPLQRSNSAADQVGLFSSFHMTCPDGLPHILFSNFSDSQILCHMAQWDAAPAAL